MSDSNSPASPAPDAWGERLPRQLGLWSAVAVLVGSTIGSGIFRTPAGVAQKIDDLPLFALAWVIGGIIAICGALTYAELAACFPRSGGVYVFVREGFGPLPAFLFGWAELLIIRPGAYGAIGLTAAAYALRIFGFDPEAQPFGLPFRGEQLVGALMIIVVATVNYSGIKRGALLQNVSTLFKAGALLGLVLLGLILGDSAGWSGLASQRSDVALSPFLLAMVAILWAYDGWADLAFVGGEVKNPERNLPRALVLGTSIVVALYLAANLVYVYLIPLADIKHSELVAADAASLLVGKVGIVLVSAAVAVSTFGTLNGSMMTAPRIFFAMADDGLFPQAIARVDPKTGAPTAAILLAATLGVVFILVRTFTELADQFVIGIWPFYALAVATVFVLRKRRPDLRRPYRTWGYPVVPALFLLASLFLLGNYLVSETAKFTLDFGVILTGIPVYFLWKRFGEQGAGSRER
ncbi:MAG TPA: amino acid permease [Gemmatimonadales bacterium]|nr:amino acid permease [Gemmatimonadales bacterium]